MDMIAVDITKLSGIHVGTPVVLWGSRAARRGNRPLRGNDSLRVVVRSQQRVPLELR